MSSPYLARGGVKIDAPIPSGCDEILSPEAIAFVVDLHHHFEPRRKELMNRRVRRQHTIDAGQLPDFLPETAEIRKKMSLKYQVEF
jgi:malate synthase